MVRVVAQPVARAGAWATHRDDVRERIVDAFLDLVATASPVGVSMPAVAERAGISVRTLYRYFPNKDELQRYAAGWLDRRVLAAMDDRPIDVSSTREYLRRMWVEFTGSLLAVHVQHGTPEGRQMRLARLPVGRRRVEQALPQAIEEPRRTEVVDLVVALCSSSMFLELVDRMGHDPVAAADLVVDVVELLIDHESGRVPAPTEGTP
jgi:AcrR family transcriptional regulator